VVAVAPDQVACEMQEELVILQLLQELLRARSRGEAGLEPDVRAQRVGSFRDQLLDEFEVDSGTCTHDLLMFLGNWSTSAYPGELCADA